MIQLSKPPLLSEPCGELRGTLKPIARMQRSVISGGAWQDPRTPEFTSVYRRVCHSHRQTKSAPPSASATRARHAACESGHPGQCPHSAPTVRRAALAGRRTQSAAPGARSTCASSRARLVAGVRASWCRSGAPCRGPVSDSTPRAPHRRRGPLLHECLRVSPHEGHGLVRTPGHNHPLSLEARAIV